MESAERSYLVEIPITNVILANAEVQGRAISRKLRKPMERRALLVGNAHQGIA